jgi:hypothetical protein
MYQKPQIEGGQVMKRLSRTVVSIVMVIGAATVSTSKGP